MQIQNKEEGNHEKIQQKDQGGQKHRAKRNSPSEPKEAARFEVSVALGKMRSLPHGLQTLQQKEKERTFLLLNFNINNV